jgi:hypothetical protein
MVPWEAMRRLLNEGDDMKASLAYFQGKFNNCTFAWESPTKCKITVLDSVNELKGSFVAEYQDSLIANIDSDNEMQSKGWGRVLSPPPPPKPSK